MSMRRTRDAALAVCVVTVNSETSSLLQQTQRQSIRKYGARAAAGLGSAAAGLGSAAAGLGSAATGLVGRGCSAETCACDNIEHSSVMYAAIHDTSIAKVVRSERNSCDMDTDLSHPS